MLLASLYHQVTIACAPGTRACKPNSFRKPSCTETPEKYHLMLETHMAADYDSSKTTYKHKRHLTMISGAPPMCKILDAKPRAPKPQVLQPKTLAKPRSSRSPFALKATLKGTLKPSPGPNASPARDPGLQDNRHI